MPDFTASRTKWFRTSIFLDHCVSIYLFQTVLLLIWDYWETAEKKAWCPSQGIVYFFYFFPDTFLMWASNIFVARVRLYFQVLSWIRSCTWLLLESSLTWISVVPFAERVMVSSMNKPSCSRLIPEFSTSVLVPQLGNSLSTKFTSRAFTIWSDFSDHLVYIP